MQVLLLRVALLLVNVFVLDLFIWLNYTLLQKDWKMGRDTKLANPDCSPIPYSKSGYNSFDEFYPFYLGEHHNRICRRLHVIGTTNAVVLFIVAALTAYYPIAIIAVPQAYTFSWIGHFVFEKNKPATFSHPIYSVSTLIKKKITFLFFKIKKITISVFTASR